MSNMTEKPNELVREANAMVAGMAPEMADGSYVFCITADPAAAAACTEQAIAMFVEAEGNSFILPQPEAERLGFDCSLPMRMITLTVHSALDGSGLTAAVSSELARLNIPCNIVAAFCHDYIFVPDHCADRSFDALVALQGRFKSLPMQD